MLGGDLNGKEIQKRGDIYIGEGNGNPLQYSCLKILHIHGPFQKAQR